MNLKQPIIWVALFFMFFLTQGTLEAQEPVILDSKMKPGISNDMRIEELKVRWKKAALENCPGVPCITNTVPGAPMSVTAVAGNTQAIVSFTAPSSTGGSAITGYTVTSNPATFPVTGTTSPINVTGLTNGTAYTFTVVATNAVGNSVPSAASSAVTPAAPSSCFTPTITDIDGTIYNTVAIGTQCWMASNLRVTKYSDGTAIPLDNTYTSASISTVWEGLTTGAYAIYGNEASSGANATNYGFLYNWYAAKGIATTGTTYKNLCPTGYHVPTDSDWNKLVIFIDSGADTSSTSGTQSMSAGTRLKKNSALWLTNTGTDDHGFSALPGGNRTRLGSFSNIRSYGNFWSATESGVTSAWYRQLYDSIGDADRTSTAMSLGASVRCLKN